MPEWIHYEHFSNQHKFVTEDGATCMSCGNDEDHHWFPRANPKTLLDEVEQIASEYDRKLLE